MPTSIFLRLLYKHGLGIALSTAITAWAWYITDTTLKSSLEREQRLTSVIDNTIKDHTENVKELGKLLIEHDKRAISYIKDSEDSSRALIEAVTNLSNSLRGYRK